MREIALSEKQKLRDEAKVREELALSEKQKLRDEAKARDELALAEKQKIRDEARAREELVFREKEQLRNEACKREEILLRAKADCGCDDGFGCVSQRAVAGPTSYISSTSTTEVRVVLVGKIYDSCQSARHVVNREPFAWTWQACVRWSQCRRTFHFLC